MIVAMITVHWEHGLFASDNGIELPLLNITAALTLALTGYGTYAVDAWLGLANHWTPSITAIVVAAGVIGGFANVAIRHRPGTTAAQAK
jgi:hypothetical protein